MTLWTRTPQDACKPVQAAYWAPGSTAGVSKSRWAKPPSMERTALSKAGSRRVIASARPAPGIRADAHVWRESGLPAAAAEATVVADGAYLGTGPIVPHRSRAGRPSRLRAARRRPCGDRQTGRHIDQQEAFDDRSTGEADTGGPAYAAVRAPTHPADQSACSSPSPRFRTTRSESWRTASSSRPIRLRRRARPDGHLAGSRPRPGK